MGQKKITVSVISDLTTDQRVIRICNTLVQMGFEVVVIARCFSNSLPLETYLFTPKRIKCYFRKGILQYVEFNLKLFFKILFIKTHYFLSNDLDTLAPNYIVASIRNKRLFYDTHEYFTGVPELRNEPFKRKAWKLVENKIFPKLTTVYTVNDSVKNKYQAEYGNDIKVIRNLPVTPDVANIPVPNKWEQKTILMMQGAGINEGRGGIELLESMKYLSDNYLLVFIGGGNMWQKIIEKRKEWELEKCVEMIEKVPPSKLKEMTPFAKIGFSLDSFEDSNCLFNLPNKIFDFIHAGVPIIATAIPEVKKIIEKYECGICIPDNKPKTIAGAVKEMLAGHNTYQTLKTNCIAAAKELNWENESKKLINIYLPFV